MNFKLFHEHATEVQVCMLPPSSLYNCAPIQHVYCTFHVGTMDSFKNSTPCGLQPSMSPPDSEREMHVLTWTAKKWLQFILTLNLSPDPSLLYLTHFRGNVGMHQAPLMGLGLRRYRTSKLIKIHESCLDLEK